MRPVLYVLVALTYASAALASYGAPIAVLPDDKRAGRRKVQRSPASTVSARSESLVVASSPDSPSTSASSEVLSSGSTSSPSSSVASPSSSASQSTSAEAAHSSSSSHHARSQSSSGGFHGHHSSKSHSGSATHTASSLHRISHHSSWSVTSSHHLSSHSAKSSSRKTSSMPKSSVPSVSSSTEQSASAPSAQVFSAGGGVKAVSMPTAAPAGSSAAASGSSSVNPLDSILDNNYDAFTDDQIYLTATTLPPFNTKVRVVAGASMASSGASATSSGPSATGAVYFPPANGMEIRAAKIFTTHVATTYLAVGTGTCPTIVGMTKVRPTTTPAVTGPVPSRSSVSCIPAPTMFAGTKDGFTNLCKGVRYCDPPVTAKYVTSSLTGEVTRGEIESLLGQLQNTGSVLANGIPSNAFADGWAGQAAYGSGLLFEVTGDVRALDNAVRVADNILALRNNPKTGRIMWTGKRELVWITKAAGGRGALYAGSENLNIIANMVNAAIFILKHPCIWHQKPQWTSAPTTFNKTSTYLDRAKAYVAAADQTVDSYFRPYWFNAQQIMIQPNSSLYAKAQDFPPGTYVPWNRRSLMISGLVSLARAHELSPLKDSVRVKRYDNLAAANVRSFVQNLLPTESRGYQTYTWYYALKPPGGTIEMVRGVHGFYDIWGMWIAWQRGIANDTLTNTVMRNLANTMAHQIYSDDSNKLFAAYVNGYANLCNLDEQPIKYLWGSYAYYAHWIPSWYTAVATAGQAQLKLTWVTAPLFWAKAAIHRNSTSFWRASEYT